MTIDKEDLEVFLKKNLSEKRFEHTLRVVEWSRELAKKNNCNEQKVIMAAYLHDVAKHYTDQEIISVLKSYDCMEEAFYLQPQVAHGIVGAIIAKRDFSINDDDILNAIRYHSFGRAGMSTLEKIIYVADATEKGRDYNGVKKARKLAKTSLDKALKYIASETIKTLLNRNKRIYPSTIDLWNDLMKKDEN